MPAKRSSMSARVSTATPPLPTSPSAARVVGVAAHQRGQVERGRQAVAAGPQDLVEAGVGVLRRAEAGEHPHGPELRAVHRGVRAPGVRVLARGTRRRRARRPARRARPTSSRRRRRSFGRRLEGRLPLVPSASRISLAGLVVRRHERGRGRPPTATWPSSWSGSPRRRRWPRPAGWAGATRRAPTAPPSTPCASCSTPCRWTASSSSARARRTRRRCSTTASGSATARRPQTDIAVDPIEGTTLTVARPGQRPLGHRGQRAGHDVQPRPVRLHGEDRRRARGRGRDRHHRAGRREPARGGQGQGQVGARRHRRHPRPRPPRPTSSPRCARPAPASASSPTATWPAPSRPRGRSRAPTSSSASAARPKGVIAAAALKCMGGEIQGGCGRATTRSASRGRRRLRPRPRAGHRRPGVGRQLLLRRHRHHRRRAAPGRALRQPRGDHAVARHALAVGHRAPHRRPPPPRPSWPSTHYWSTKPLGEELADGSGLDRDRRHDVGRSRRCDEGVRDAHDGRGGAGRNHDDTVVRRATRLDVAPRGAA